MLVTPDYTVLFANRFFRERFGECTEKRCFESLFKRDTPCDECETRRVQNTSEALGARRHRSADGRNYHFFHFPFTDSDGATSSSSWLSISPNASELKRSSSRHREHLEELVRQRTREIEARNARLDN